MRQRHVVLLISVRLQQWLGGSRSPEGSWTIFGGVASRHFMYTAILHLLYSGFGWGCLVTVGCYNGPRFKTGWKPLVCSYEVWFKQKRCRVLYQSLKDFFGVHKSIDTCLEKHSSCYRPTVAKQPNIPRNTRVDYCHRTTHLCDQKVMLHFFAGLHNPYNGGFDFMSPVFLNFGSCFFSFRFRLSLFLCNCAKKKKNLLWAPDWNPREVSYFNSKTTHDVKQTKNWSSKAHLDRARAKIEWNIWNFWNSRRKWRVRHRKRQTRNL